MSSVRVSAPPAFLPVSLRVCSVISTVDSAIEYFLCLLYFNTTRDRKELEGYLCPPFPVTALTLEILPSGSRDAELK